MNKNKKAAHATDGRKTIAQPKDNPPALRQQLPGVHGLTNQQIARRYRGKIASVTEYTDLPFRLYVCKLLSGRILVLAACGRKHAVVEAPNDIDAVVFAVGQKFGFRPVMLVPGTPEEVERRNGRHDWY